MPPVPSPSLPRIITYYQSQHDAAGKVISPVQLIRQPGIALTHLIVAAIHLNDDPLAITLNNDHPSSEGYVNMWAELRILQASGVKVMGMLGGAAKGSYMRLDGPDAQFERYYVPLRDIVREHGLDGLDLDVEEPMSLGGVVRLIDRLRADFGPAFVISLAPVAAALLDARTNLSGFDYMELERVRGREIAFYNAQFYCGWGDISSPLMYEMVLMKGWSPDKVVVGLVTNPENANGWVPWEVLAEVLPVLVARHPRFGGVMGWEYFNSLPGGRERPWEWAREMTTLLRGQRTGGLVAGQQTLGGGGGVGGKGAASSEADPDEEGGQEAPVPGAFEYHSDGSEEA